MKNGARVCPMPGSQHHPKFCSTRCGQKVRNQLYVESLRSDPEKLARDREARQLAAAAPHRIEAREAYQRANRDKQKIRNQRFWSDPVKAERARERNKENSRANRRERSKAHVEWVKRRRREDPGFKAIRNLRSRLYYAVVRAQSGQKTASAADLVGCTPQELVAYLESLFLPGMSWDNYSLHGWHIDHIKPCAAFDLTDPEQQRECFHYTNLQPLWCEENRAKSDLWKPATMAA
jgi:hypothetical protein